MPRPSVVILRWQRFASFIEARRAFACIYVQADRAARPVRVGMASRGLEARYRGGTGWALEAAMHEAGNVVFVAPVAEEACAAIEATLIWTHRDVLTYNQQGKRQPPGSLVRVRHAGTSPAW